MIHDNAARREETRTDSRDLSLKKDQGKLKLLGNVSYIYSATNLNLDANTSNSIISPYISGAGGFQPRRVQCLSQLHFYPAGAFGFLLSTGSRNTTPAYFFTSNSCDK